MRGRIPHEVPSQTYRALVFVRDTGVLRVSPRGNTAGMTRKERNMGITASLLLTAAGAVLTWGVNATVTGLNIHTIGVILMVVGIVGFFVSLMFWSSWGGFGGYGPGRDTTIVRDHDTIDRRV